MKGHKEKGFTYKDVVPNNPSIADELITRVSFNNTEVETFAQRALRCIWWFAEKLDLENQTSLNSALLKWLIDDVHGLVHSYQVYEKGKEIRNTERLLVSNDDLFIRAVIHDLSEFLPLMNHTDLTEIRMKATGSFVPIDKDTELSLEDEQFERIWKEKHHPTLMAWVVRFIGDKLEHDNTETHEIATDIYYHDHFWRKPSREQIVRCSSLMSDSGKIIADADKHATDETDISRSVKASIERCWCYGIGREHFFRNITPEEQWKWRARSGGFYDTLTPLLALYAAPDFYFYTSSGRNMNEVKKSLFKKEIILFAEDIYIMSREKLSHVLPKNGVFTVEYGIKNDTDLFSLSGENLNDILTQIYNTPVGNLVDDDGRQRYGYNLIIDGEWIDPSIVLFESKEDLSNALVASITTYEALAIRKEERIDI